jgi:hypothetical protein
VKKKIVMHSFFSMAVPLTYSKWLMGEHKIDLRFGELILTGDDDVLERYFDRW